MLAIVIIFFGIAARLLGTVPNFTPVLALALFSGVHLKREYAVIVPLLLIVLSDLMIGLHDTLFFTWGSVVLTSMIGLWVRERKSAGAVFAGSLASSLIFFIITNFGAWLTLYPLTPRGLQACYVAAIPFFRPTLVSTLVYACIFFGAFELAARSVKNPKLARRLFSQ